MTVLVLPVCVIIFKQTQVSSGRPFGAWIVTVLYTSTLAHHSTIYAANQMFRTAVQWVQSHGAVRTSSARHYGQSADLEVRSRKMILVDFYRIQWCRNVQTLSFGKSNFCQCCVISSKLIVGTFNFSFHFYSGQFFPSEFVSGCFLERD